MLYSAVLVYQNNWVLLVELTWFTCDIVRDTQRIEKFESSSAFNTSMLAMSCCTLRAPHLCNDILYSGFWLLPSPFPLSIKYCLVFLLSGIPLWQGLPLWRLSRLCPGLPESWCLWSFDDWRRYNQAGVVSRICLLAGLFWLQWIAAYVPILLYWRYLCIALKHNVHWPVISYCVSAKYYETMLQVYDFDNTQHNHQMRHQEIRFQSDILPRN